MKQLKDLLSVAMNPSMENRNLRDNESCQSKEIRDMYADENGFFKYVVPSKYSKVTLETCDKQPREYIEFAKQWAIKPTSIFLCGGYGTGKTHFAFAMIREMFRRCQK